MTDLWERIAPSRDPEAINLRRADAQHPLDFFRGRDHDGRYLFVLKARTAPPRDIELPQLAHLELSLEPRDGDSWELCIKLLESSHADIFRALCANLMAATENLNSNQDGEGISIVLARLVRWRELLKGRRHRRLSETEVIGLFGELLFLRDLALRELPPMRAVAAWRGPLSEEQDFQLGDWLIEVKTQLSSADSKLAVSSENQLDTRSGRILICHQTLAVARPGEGAARTLISLVDEVAEQLALDDSGAADRFHATLLDYGYVPDAGYATDTWTLQGRTFFDVADGFPRITPRDLPLGVSSVRYDVKLSACETFMISEGVATAWVFGDD